MGMENIRSIKRKGLVAREERWWNIIKVAGSVDVVVDVYSAQIQKTLWGLRFARLFARLFDNEQHVFSVDSHAPIMS